MAEKLRSISAQIPWSLAVKAAVFGFAWYALSPGLFLVLAVLLYLIPIFHVRKLAIPFLVLLAVSDLVPRGEYDLMIAIALAGAYYLLDGVKNLVFVGRHAPYRALVLFLLFAVLMLFFTRAVCESDGACPAPGSALESLVVAGVAFLFLRSTLHSAFAYLPDASRPQRFAREHLAAGLITILLWELLWVLLFLPLNFFSQSALAFLGVVMLLELIELRMHGRLTRRAILLHTSIFLAFLVVLLAANEWSV